MHRRFEFGCVPEYIREARLAEPAPLSRRALALLARPVLFLGHEAGLRRLQRLVAPPAATVAARAAAAAAAAAAPTAFVVARGVGNEVVCSLDRAKVDALAEGVAKFARFAMAHCGAEEAAAAEAAAASAAAAAAGPQLRRSGGGSGSFAAAARAKGRGAGGSLGSGSGGSGIGIGSGSGDAAEQQSQPRSGSSPGLTGIASARGASVSSAGGGRAQRLSSVRFADR